MLPVLQCCANCLPCPTAQSPTLATCRAQLDPTCQPPNFPMIAQPARRAQLPNPPNLPQPSQLAACQPSQRAQTCQPSNLPNCCATCWPCRAQLPNPLPPHLLDPPNWPKPACFAASDFQPSQLAQTCQPSNFPTVAYFARLQLPNPPHLPPLAACRLTCRKPSKLGQPSQLAQTQTCQPSNSPWLRTSPALRPCRTQLPN